MSTFGTLNKINVSGGIRQKYCTMKHGLKYLWSKESKVKIKHIPQTPFYSRLKWEGYLQNEVNKCGLF